MRDEYVSVYDPDGKISEHSTWLNALGSLHSKVSYSAHHAVSHEGYDLTRKVAARDLRVGMVLRFAGIRDEITLMDKTDRGWRVETKRTFTGRHTHLAPKTTAFDFMGDSTHDVCTYGEHVPVIAPVA